ncbi:MAG: transcription antitermination factor NusB [Clostridiales Family XIII bacterium]|jgi:N utilization substance protein B|nr:transcription antitermination factor NusB [Clostridiales Family XIII bacterium]
MADRRSARELLMMLVYQMSVTDDWSDDERDCFLAEGEGMPKPNYRLDGKADRAYFDAVLEAVRGHRDELDELIEKASLNWKIKRISKVDLAILRLAAAEILHADDIPISVSINEAVELARKYGGEKSYEFVNGVLGKIVEPA